MDYIGHPLQCRGAEKVIMEGGKAQGMHFLIVRNGLGLECWISLDRCADLMRVTYQGKNMGYLSPCGNVAPQYYDKDGLGFLKSFTAGFFTTAGLTAVGSPCEDDGEVLPLHGTVANTPAELNGIEESEEAIVIRTTVRDCRIFATKLVLQRTYTVSYTENVLSVRDTVTNEADRTSPFMILYHCNMGYPLLSESSTVILPNNGVKARDAHAQTGLANALQMEKPQAGFAEMCYYYDMKETDGLVKAGLYNPDCRAGVILSYRKSELPCFTEWKMMGKKDYVLGLEPGNCNPDGRDVARRNGTLPFIEPDQTVTTGVCFTFVDRQTDFENRMK